MEPSDSTSVLVRRQPIKAICPMEDVTEGMKRGRSTTSPRPQPQRSGSGIPPASPSNTSSKAYVGKRSPSPSTAAATRKSPGVGRKPSPSGKRPGSSPAARKQLIRTKSTDAVAKKGVLGVRPPSAPLAESAVSIFSSANKASVELEKDGADKAAKLASLTESKFAPVQDAFDDMLPKGEQMDRNFENLSISKSTLSKLSERRFEDDPLDDYLVGDEIDRHPTAGSSRAAGACPPVQAKTPMGLSDPQPMVSPPQYIIPLRANVFPAIEHEHPTHDTEMGMVSVSNRTHSAPVLNKGGRSSGSSKVTKKSSKRAFKTPASIVVPRLNFNSAPVYSPKPITPASATESPLSSARSQHSARSGISIISHRSAFSPRSMNAGSHHSSPTSCSSFNSPRKRGGHICNVCGK